jgi:short-subunit dehydrogenase
MELADKRILITGGSSGIGLALAERFAAAGARLFLTARGEDRLQAAVLKLQAMGASVAGAAADVGTAEGRALTLATARAAMGGIDVLVNNAGGVRAGRLEEISEAEIEAMVTVDLLAPILLTRAALPALRESGDSLVINIASGLALVGAPFYATYAAAKAGLARFGEALRRELKGEGIHVLTAYPAATDTPMMKSSKAGPELGFTREPVEAVADAILAAVREGAFSVIRGGEAREKMIRLNREAPEVVDQRFFDMKAGLAEAVKEHSAL